MNISEHISLKEATKSDTAIHHGISNQPTTEHLEAMKLVANAIFEPLRAHFGKPLGVSSFYRSKALNEKIKGSSTSQHCKGEAIDIDADIYNNGITNKEIFDWIKANLKFDQLIFEYGTPENPDWVHVSYTKTGNRNQTLIAYKEGKTTKYKPYGQ